MSKLFQCEAGIDSNELGLIERALISYERELSTQIKTYESLIQKAIDMGDAARVDSLARLMKSAHIELLNAEGIRMDLDPRPGHELARIIIIDVDQTNIQ